MDIALYTISQLWSMFTLLQLFMFDMLMNLSCMNIADSALQIFKLESHPSGFKAETGREGFSLYGK